MTADLRIVVLTYGTARRHEPLIRSLLAEGVDAPQILVVHNPSAPAEPAPPAPEGCEVVRASHNLGYAAGMNVGIGRQLERGAQFVLLLTHDARLEPGCLARLLDIAGRQPRFGALGPVLMLPGGEEAFSYGGILRRDGTVEHVQARPPRDAVAECDWIDGGIMLLRASVLRQVGGFDEGFWSYCEEAELCLRIQRSGYRVGVVLAAEAEQSPGAQNRPGLWAYLMTRNGAAYATRGRGLLGLAGFLAWTGTLLAKNLARVALRGLGLRPGSAREPWALVRGMSRGGLDYFRGRWGPPPEGLPGAGDISNTSPPSGEGGADE